MKRNYILFMTLTFIMTFWCNRLYAGGMEESDHEQAVDGDAKILHIRFFVQIAGNILDIRPV